MIVKNIDTQGNQMPIKPDSSKTTKDNKTISKSVVDDKSLTKMIYTGYALIALSMILQSIFPAIIGLVLMFVISKTKCEQWQKDHIKWIEKTSWVGLICALPLVTLGLLLDVGYFWLFLGIFTIPLYIWLGMRVIKGCLWLLNNQKPMKLNSWFW